MPTYGYECKSCGHGFEVIQKITDDPLQICEECGGQLKKKIFPVGIVFKGSGFYVNDYAPKGGETTEPKATPESAETKAAPATETTATDTSGTTPESKPAEKTAAAPPAASAPAASAKSDT